MKLKNKKTGEIGYTAILQSKAIVVMDENAIQLGSYTSLAELNEEWEDAPEEPKEDGLDHIITLVEAYSNYDSERYPKEIVEKLKAWKRLKDSGITFKNWTINQTGTIDCFATWGNNIPPSRKDPTLQEDLDLLFSGEDD